MLVTRDWMIPHTETVSVDGARLACTSIGSGEPVLAIHGLNIADSIVGPFQLYPEIFERYRFISYHRAGYHGSTMDNDAVSIDEGVTHARQVLEHFEVDRAHVLAYSFGGIIAFQLALTHPELIHTLTLLEAYLPKESAVAVDANQAAYLGAMKLYEDGQKLAAAQAYQEAICGPSFFSSVDLTCARDVWERVEEAADTVFTIDLPAAFAWPFRASRADDFVESVKPNMPVLAVLGMDSEAACPGFRETQRFLMDWLPQAERHGVVGATHGLQMMNPGDVVEACSAFFAKHPMPS